MTIKTANGLFHRKHLERHSRHSNLLPALQREYPRSTNMAIPIRYQLYDGNTQHPQIWPFQFAASFTTGIPKIHKYGHSNSASFTTAIPNIHKYGHSNSLPALQREYPTSTNMTIPIRCQLYDGNTQHTQIWLFQFTASFTTGIPNIHKYGHSN